MNEPSDGAICIGGLIVVGVAFALIYQTDRRIKREGVTFTQSSSPKSRIYALLLGIFLSGFFLLVWIAWLRLRRSITFPIRSMLRPDSRAK